jgi:hypothetical protein
MAEGYEVEIVRRVYDNVAGAYVEVGPDGDGLGIVEIRTSGKNVDHFGPIRFAIAPDMALALADAIKACAEEMR